VNVECDCTINKTIVVPLIIAYEEVLRGALAAGREKERELATTFLEFEYRHRKSQCKMLHGEDNIGNDFITLGACYHIFFITFVYIYRAHFGFTLIGRNLTAQLPWRACSQAKLIKHHKC